MSTIVVDDKGTEFSYLDSGVPAQTTSYITIIAIHGMGFMPGIFKKVMALSSKANVRFIAIVRRGYPGSTPFSEAEIAASTGGTDDEKAAFVDARGVELALVVDKLIQQLNLPPISENGKDGGIALLGWSGGTTWASSCIANMDHLPRESQSRMTTHIRAHIIQEPPSVCLGLPLPSKLWSPLIDTSLPEDQRIPFYMPWITSYFDHGDLSSRDIDVISYYTPSVYRTPSIYSMSAEEIKELVIEGPLGLECTVMVVTQSQSNAVYRKACYSKGVKEMLPSMRTTVLVGDATCSFSLNGTFSIQDDNEKFGGNISFDIIRGANHFIHWDEPEKSFKAYVDAIL